MSLEETRTFITFPSHQYSFMVDTNIGCLFGQKEKNTRYLILLKLIKLL